MKLSIFRQAKPLPKTKEEKAKSAKSAINPEVVDVSTEELLIEMVTNYCWSPFVFKGTRKQENFLSTDFAVLDIDEGLTIEEAERIISEANFMCLCLPTTSHKPEAHRFRIIFPLSRTIKDIDEYKATMEDLREVFPMSDPSCLTDTARLFFSGTMEDGFFIEGDLLEPVKPAPKPQKQGNSSFSNRGDTSAKVLVEDDIKEIITELYGEEREKIPEAVDHFIRNAHTGLSGTWTCDLNRFAYVLSLQGVEHDVIVDLTLYLAPRGELTKRDEDTIRRAVEDGIRDREEPDII